MSEFKRDLESYLNNFKGLDIQTREKLQRDVIRIYDKSDISKNNVIVFDDITVDEGAMTFKVKNKEVKKLKPKEFRLAAFLVKNRHLAFSRDKILRYVWGDDIFVTDRTVDVHIFQIRKKLKRQGFLNVSEKFITVPGYGYRFLQN